jgi:hypothetical protein
MKAFFNYGFLVFTLFGCSKILTQSKLSAAAQGPTHSLMTVWTGTSVQPSVDLSKLSSGNTHTLRFDLDDGTSCICTASSNVTELGGKLQIASCTYNGSTSQNPNCANFVDQYTLLNNGAGLQITDSHGSSEGFQ